MSEVIELLNTSAAAPDIPARQSVPAPPTEPKASTAAVKKTARPAFLDESDDDEDYGANMKAKKHLGSISAESVCTLLGHHTNVNVYPESTEVWCHNCAHPFSGIPVMLPTRQCARSGRFEVHGTFCSFNCAKRRALDLNLPRSMEYCALLSLMHKKVTGERARVVPAPPKIALKVFGGTMDIDEYRASFLQLPPTPDMYDMQKRKILVKELQSRMYPVLAKLHITNEQAVIDEAVLGPRPVTKAYDRSKPVPARESSLASLGLNMSVVHSNDNEHEDE